MTVNGSKNRIVGRFHEESTAGLAEGTQKRFRPLPLQDFISLVI